MTQEAETYLADLRSLKQRRAALFGGVTVHDAVEPSVMEGVIARSQKATKKLGHPGPPPGKKMSLTAAVLEVLKAGPMTTAEIRSMIESRKLVDIKNLPAQLGMTLSKLKKDGKISQPEKRGPYSVPDAA